MDKIYHFGRVKFAMLLIILSGLFTNLFSQSFTPPVPLEAFIRHKALYYQMVLKRQFSPESKFAMFGLATYTADYNNDLQEHDFVMINQISYLLGKGFNIMAGADMNSAVGISPIVGPQHNYSSRRILAVTVVSFFLNGEEDIKLFGLYEFKPPINDQWSWYHRIQFIYNHSLGEGEHNKNYLYLRSGFKKEKLMFGLAANLDQSGPNKIYKDNYGVFFRWEF